MLTTEPSGQALKPWHIGQLIGPGSTPVHRRVGTLGFARRSTCSISRGSARLLERFRIAAVAAFHSRQFAARGEAVALPTTGKMPGDLKVSNHVSFSYAVITIPANTARLFVATSAAAINR